MRKKNKMGYNLYSKEVRRWLYENYPLTDPPESLNYRTYMSRLYYYLYQRRDENLVQIADRLQESLDKVVEEKTNKILKGIKAAR